ncbi:DUF2567 domain-containing protein [Jiangella mangrovi]|uniref:Xanthosine utilization system XapX-like protein n=1 Tax=Jiangella mangrovi TaxID=1524084 RepID=A0A7W9LMZ9_9ACTN|nr:DUF2567 domain-containing protein [Jiangella mangrovi]MBB5789719.1 xanthosine utilization system XapX-like protein [Jiangella mangrovi]
MTTRAERLGHTGPGPVRVVAQIVVASVVAGIVMGVLWWLLSPDVRCVVVDGQLSPSSCESRVIFERDAVFTLLGAGFGLVFGAAFAVWHRRHPVTTLVALAVFGVAGSLIARFAGGLLGPSDDVAGLADGTDRLYPLLLDADAALLVWSMVAVVVAAIIALFREDQTPWSVPGPAER